MRAKTMAAALVVAAVTVAQAWAGITYTARTTAEGGKGAEMQASVVQSWIDGNNAKVEFLDSKNPVMAKGSYMVTTDGGTTLHLVNPKEKTYSKFDIENMSQFAGGAMKMMNMKFTDPKVEELGEEPGGLIVGIPTTRYKYRTTYTMTMSFMGMKKATKTEQIEEIWVAPKLVEKVLGLWLHKNPPKTGNEELDGLVRAQRAKVQGFPLKRRTETMSTDEKGNAQKAVVTMEVTDWQVTSVPASAFVIPPDYKETDMFSAMGGESKEGENPFARMMGGGKKKE